MDASKKAVLICAVIMAVLVPFAVLGNGWIGEDDRDIDRKPRLMLGSDAERDSQKMGKKNCWKDIDLEEIKENLDLTEEEEARLDELLGDIEGLKEQMNEKLEEVKEIIGPKIEEMAEEMREECAGMAEQMKPLLEELKDLHIRLKEALEAGNEEDVDAIKAEMEEVTDQLHAIRRELGESDCGRVMPPKAKERMEVFRDRCKKIHERMREAFRSRVEKRECMRETWEDLSGENQETLKALHAEIIELKKEIQDAIKEQDPDRVDEIRSRIAELMEDIRNLYVESGLAGCYRG